MALEPGNIIAAFEALATLGCKPLVPVTAEQFANAQLREANRPRDLDDVQHLQWIRDDDKSHD